MSTTTMEYQLLCWCIVHQKLSSIYVDATVQVSDSVVFKEKREDNF